MGEWLGEVLNTGRRRRKGYAEEITKNTKEEQP
jgi:hypothetical protein